jgi:hypothetical protein
MRSFVPFVLVFLAIFIAGCIAFIAWELSAEQPTRTDPASKDAGDAPASRDP